MRGSKCKQCFWAPTVWVSIRYPAGGCGKRWQSTVGRQKSSPVSCCPYADASYDSYCAQGGEVSPQAAALAVTGVASSLSAALTMNHVQARVKPLQTLSDVGESCWICTAVL